MKILFVFGTRPEAIKMAPVIKLLQNDKAFETRVCLTGQHREMIDKLMDNAASFSILAPLLDEYYVVAVDLTGHGLSDHRSVDATYQIWDDLPELMGVLQALGWEHFYLLGHSRGAIISCLLASACPERVERLVLLDGIAFQAVPEDQFPAQMRMFLDQKRHWLQRQNRVYTSVDAALASRSDAWLPADAIRLLVERNLHPCEGGFTWTTDLRLRGASAVKLSAGQIHAVLSGLTMPALLLLADDGFGGRPEIAALATETIQQLELGRVVGGHHFHMEPGAAIVAQQINRFLQT